MRKCSSESVHILVTAALIAAVLLLVACGHNDEKKVNESLSLRCVIVTADATDNTGWQYWFKEHMPSSPRFPIADIQSASRKCLDSDTILILPGPYPLDTKQKAVVDRHISSGGRLLTCGLNVETPIHASIPTYSFTSDVLRINGQDKLIRVEPRKMIRECDQGNNLLKSPDRNIPVAAALNAEGNILGRPAEVHLVSVDDGRHAILGRIGMNAVKEDTGALVPLLEQMVDVLSRKIYLHRFGVNQHSARSRTPLTAQAEWIDRRSHDLSPVRLSVEWVNAKGLPEKNIVSTPLDPLIKPITLNIGLAPDIGVRTKRYALRFSIRDRNDLFTYDSFIQEFKVFSYEEEENAADFVTVNTGQLFQRRRPVFMLGVNYWPRHSSSLLSIGEHWLNAAYFDPEILSSDLDLMVSGGINAIALEYTDINQAPQIRWVLDELRERGMWACLYIPALHPLDLRIDDAKRMLEALRAKEWPQIFAIEIARGLAVKPRSETRLLDPAWADWVNEHFNSPIEAEQKLGISLRRERGRLAGLTDAAVIKGPQHDQSVALYYAFLNDHVSRQMRFVRDWLDEHGYHTLMTARTRYGWPDTKNDTALDYLDISAGALHQDFLFPDYWSTHPLRTMNPDCYAISSYAFGAGGGKPVLCSEYGQHAGSNADPAALQRQKEVYTHYLNTFVKTGISGAFSWWYPPGTIADGGNDWGIVNFDGTWRPVEDVFRSVRYAMRQKRVKARTPIRESTQVVRSAKHWQEMMKNRSGLFAEDRSSEVNEWTPMGTGMSSTQLLHRDNIHRWSEIDAFVLLNAEWGNVRVDESKRERKPGENIRVYVGSKVEMVLINTGSISWEKADRRKAGSVWIRISQPGSADVWLSSASLKRGEKQDVLWIPRDTGPWEIQPYLIGYGKFGERLKVEVTTPPQLY